jgi:hypothetical protein
MKHTVVAVSALTLGLFASTAWAEEKSNVTTIATTTVHGRAQKPGVVVVLTRARMQLGATTPTLASRSEIQDASKKDSFR